jgi:hypothetical protein
LRYLLFHPGGRRPCVWHIRQAPAQHLAPRAWMLQQRLSSLSHRASDTRVSGIIRDFHLEIPGSSVYIHWLLFDSQGGRRGGDGSRFGRLKTDFVNRIFQPLLAAKVQRCRLNADMSLPFPWSAVDQFPISMPCFFTPLTRRIPAARPGLRSPQPATSYARRRMAASRRLIVEDAYWACSRLIARLRVVIWDSRGGSCVLGQHLQDA